MKMILNKDSFDVYKTYFAEVIAGKRSVVGVEGMGGN